MGHRIQTHAYRWGTHRQVKVTNCKLVTQVLELLIANHNDKLLLKTAEVIIFYPISLRENFYCDTSHPVTPIILQYIIANKRNRRNWNKCDISQFDTATWKYEKFY